METCFYSIQMALIDLTRHRKYTHSLPHLIKPGQTIFKLLFRQQFRNLYLRFQQLILVMKFTLLILSIFIQTQMWMNYCFMYNSLRGYSSIVFRIAILKYICSYLKSFKILHKRNKFNGSLLIHKIADYNTLTLLSVTK